MTAVNPRVVVAMSGGVDSTVAAALLREQGCEIIGVTLQLQDQAAVDGASCAADGGEQARDTAAWLGIEHHMLDARAEFERIVLRYSWDEYARGRTPNPCVVCNKQIKFGLLLDHARSLGADRIATGHYARVVAGENGPELWRGVDRRKDQSYFLFALHNEQLAATLFPLGGMTKTQVRETARRLGVPNAERAESQDACFLAEGEGYAELLRQHFMAPARPGAVVDTAGQPLGKHAGIHLYTIGQRRGLGIALGRRAWVASINPVSAQVVLADDESTLLAPGLVATDVVWHGHVEPGQSCMVQIRYRHPPVPAAVEPLSGGRARVRFAQPVKAATPGQAVVFYNGERVLGGGWIERTEEAAE